MDMLKDQMPPQIDFLEVAPENWIDVGGRRGQQFRALAERMPIVCHGLSLNLGGPAPLDETFLLRVKQFLDDFDVPVTASTSVTVPTMGIFTIYCPYRLPRRRFGT